MSTFSQTSGKELLVRAPGRVDISSGAADWCGFCTLAIAIDLYASVKIRARADSLVGIRFGERHEVYDPAAGADETDFVRAIVSESRQCGFDLELTTEIPRQAGLGGSGSLGVATLYAIREFFSLPWNRYYLAEVAQRVESRRLKTVQGYQDQYIPAFGGLLLMDFKYKNSRPIAEEPYATVEQLASYNRTQSGLHLLIVNPGILHDSGQKNDVLQQRYLAGEAEIVALINRLDLLGRQAKKAIVDGDWDSLWLMINENQEIMRRFERSSETHETIIREALHAGAKAAKCTGAGNGAVAVFCENDRERRQVAAALALCVAVKETFSVNMADGVGIIE